MTLHPEPLPTLSLRAAPAPVITLSTSFRIPAPDPANLVRMVRERALSPSHPPIDGTLMTFVNGLLTEPDEMPALSADDTCTLVYYTLSQ